MYTTYKKNTDPGPNPDRDLVINIDGVKVTISAKDGGSIKMENLNDYSVVIKIMLFDEDEELEYVNDFKVQKGTKEVKLQLSKGKYNGFLKAKVEDKKIIEQFEVK